MHPHRSTKMAIHLYQWDLDEADLKDCITEYFWQGLVQQGRLDYYNTVSTIVKDVQPDIAKEVRSI